MTSSTRPSPEFRAWAAVALDTYLRDRAMRPAREEPRLRRICLTELEHYVAEEIRLVRAAVIDTTIAALLDMTRHPPPRPPTRRRRPPDHPSPPRPPQSRASRRG